MFIGDAQRHLIFFMIYALGTALVLRLETCSRLLCRAFFFGLLFVVCSQSALEAQTVVEPSVTWWTFIQGGTNTDWTSSVTLNGMPRDGQYYYVLNANEDQWIAIRPDGVSNDLWNSTTEATSGTTVAGELKAIRLTLAVIVNLLASMLGMGAAHALFGQLRFT